MLIDDYLEFVAARCRPNTLLATAYDLKVFFSEIPKEPADVVTADIFSFITTQKKPRRGTKVIRLEDGEAGLSARTIKRRLASVSGLFGHLITGMTWLSSATRCPPGWPVDAEASAGGRRCCEPRCASSRCSSPPRTRA
ncbi:hypothetical protein AB0M95_35350 [Sphaerisporangium sp. NPDC051017]|uniref:hypothetical protein n=1 Tax=Sphaerisporangium sp. NPDC051017 TaxID=3154636 RepID=UPI0034370813